MICLSKTNHKGEIYNLGTGTNHSINEIAEMFKSETMYIPKRHGEAMITLADISETEKYGYEPKQLIVKYVNNFLQKNVFTVLKNK